MAPSDQASPKGFNAQQASAERKAIPAENLEAYKRSSDFFYQAGVLEKVPRIEVAEWADTRIVDGVLKEIGTSAKADSIGRALR